MMNTTRHAIHALLLFAGIVTTAFAEEKAPRQFDIELLIYQNLSASDGGEVWPVDYSGWFEEEIPELNAAQSGNTRHAPTLAPAWLDGNNLKLKAEQQAMKRSANYRPLRHLAWRQTVVDRDHAKDIEIPATSGDNTAKIEGTVRVAVERYLHLYLDLKLVDPSLALNTGFTDYDLPEFRLTQHRRMRSKELHYFDHPKFGVIAFITPYTPAAPVEEPAQ
jgi:hypothetical protein